MSECDNSAHALCGDCAYCVGLLETRPIESITPKEWRLIRARARLVNGCRPLIELVPNGKNPSDNGESLPGGKE